MESIKNFLIILSKSTFFWNVLNGTITIITTELTGIGWEGAGVVLAILSLVTKQLNKNYNPYYNDTTETSGQTE